MTPPDANGGKEPRPYEYEAFGILNPYGDVWTPEFFEEPGDAYEHLKVFWGPRYAEHARGFRVVPVSVVVTTYNLECAMMPPWDAALSNTEPQT